MQNILIYKFMTADHLGLHVERKVKTDLERAKKKYLLIPLDPLQYINITWKGVALPISMNTHVIIIVI